MADTSADRDLLLSELADDFAARYRRGERPALTEYVTKHPELADDIREFFPAMVEMEVVKAAAVGVVTAGEIHLPPLEHFGDFHILREIGRGGMGVVYEAEQVSLGRRVALKLLTQRMLRDRVQKRRFEREAKAAARLHHTNIVPVFGSGELEGTPYYVMQFIQGLGLDVVSEEIARLDGRPKARAGRDDISEVAQSLMTGDFHNGECEHSSATSRAVADSSGIAVSMTQPGSSATSNDRHRKLTYWQGVARIGLQVAEALDYAHRQGIIHRDVKPSNLLLDLSGTAWVTDFGLAKGEDHDNLTRTGDMLGTLRYMPPEAFEGKSDLRGDVYGLGITLYELLALRAAYDERDRNKLIKLVSSADPPRLRRLRANIPRDLETIVHKAIDREPNRRYGSAAEMAADLQRFLADEPIKARQISTRERTWRWCRRNPFDASLLAVLALALMGGLIGVLWQWRQAVTARGVAETETVKTKQAQEQTAATLYYSNIARARLEQQANNTRGAEAILDRCPPEFRGWEWHYLNGLNHSDLMTLNGHTHWVNSVAFSPDGKLIASAGGGNPFWGSQGEDAAKPGEVILWNALTGKVTRTLRGHTNLVSGVAFNPDGTKLATVSPDLSVRLWNVATGEEIRNFGRHGNTQTETHLCSVAFSPDGKRLAIGEVGGVNIWSLAGSGNPVFVRAPNEYGAELAGRIAFTHDGQRLVCKGQHPIERTTMVWVADLSPGQSLMKLESPTCQGSSFAVSPDDRFVAAGDDTVIKIWDLKTGRLIRTLMGHQDAVEALAFSPDGLTLASGGIDSTIRLWNLDRGKETAKFLGHLGQIRSVAFSPGGDMLVSGSADLTVKVWDLTADAEFDPNDGGIKGDREALAFTPDDRQVVVYYRHELASVASYDATDRTMVNRHGVPLDSRWLTPATPACLDQQARWITGIHQTDRRVVGCYDVATGRERALLRGHTVPVWHVGMSDDGHRIVTGSMRLVRPDVPGEVKVWDANRSTVLWETAEKNLGVTAVAISPKGDVVSFAGSLQDNWTKAVPTIIRVYSVANGQLLRETTVENEPVYALAFDRDGQRLIAAGGKDLILLWNITTGEETITHQGPPMAQDIAVSPDGRRIAVAGRSMTKLLDAVTGEEILSLTDRWQAPGTTPGYNPRVRWSHDGTMLALNSGVPEGNFSIWSITTGEPQSTTNKLDAVAQRATTKHALLAGTRGDSPSIKWARQFHLNWIRNADLSNAWDLANRGAAFYYSGDDERANSDLAAAVVHQPMTGMRLFEFGADAAAHGHWAKSTDYCARALAATWKTNESHQTALAIFSHQDSDLYRHYALPLFNRFNVNGGGKFSLVSYVVRPDSGIDTNEFLSFCRKLRADPQRSGYCPLYCYGLAEYRAGNFQAALTAFDGSSTASDYCPREWIYSLRALALARLGRVDEARAAFQETVKVLDATTITDERPNDRWAHWLIGQTLRCEAEELIRKAAIQEQK